MKRLVLCSEQSLAMEKRRFSLLFLAVWTAYAFSSTLAKFAPVDNYLLNCGSAVDAIFDIRKFSGDSDASNSLVSTPSRTISVSDRNPVPSTPKIYQTARVFTKPSKYEFSVRDKGTHTVRIHFNRFNSSNWELDGAQFHVLVDGFVLLKDFGGENTFDVNPVVKEYLVPVDAEKLVITFIPSGRSKFGFVNAIEVISAPKDMILETAQMIDGGKLVNFDQLNRQALEVIYRINVGGPKVTPFNDSLWRNWIPDDEYVQSSFGSKEVYFGGRIKYRTGGASREVCPDNVYNSARVIQSTNASIPNVNMTWEFPVTGNHKYLVRLHFCDIASIAIGLLYFNVYVNGFLALEDFDLSATTSYVMASPHYADFLIDGGNGGALSVSIGPSKLSFAHGVDGILNGVEIMKLNNSMGSLDGQRCSGFIRQSWPKEHSTGVVVPLIAVVCILVIFSLTMRRKMAGALQSGSWTRLPTDAIEVGMKHIRHQTSAKV